MVSHGLTFAGERPTPYAPESIERQLAADPQVTPTTAGHLAMFTVTPTNRRTARPIVAAALLCFVVAGCGRSGPMSNAGTLGDAQVVPFDVRDAEDADPLDVAQDVTDSDLDGGSDTPPEDVRGPEDTRRDVPRDSAPDATLDTARDADVATDSETPDVDVGSECTVDGARCDDRDPCTHDDRCLGDRCVGQVGQDHPPRVLATARPRFLGAGTAVGTERYLFARTSDSDDRTLLTLVQTPVSGGIDILDELWVEGARTRVEFLREGVALVSNNASASLVHFEGDTLAERSVVPVGMSIREAALFGERLLVCANQDWIVTRTIEFDVSRADAPRRIGEHPGGCRSVVASSDGAAAFLVTAAGGVRRMTPSAVGVSTGEETGLAADALHAGNGFLSLTSRTMVHVVDEATFATVAEISAEDAGGVPRAVLRNARVTSRGLETIVDGPTGVEVVVFTMRPGESPVLIERGRATVDPGGSAGGVGTWVSHDDGIRMAGLFVFDDTPPFVRRVEDPNQSWPGPAVVVGSVIYLRDRTRSVELTVDDLSNIRGLAGRDHEGQDGLAVDLFDTIGATARGAGVYAGGLYEDVPSGARSMRTPLAQHAYPIPLVLRRFEREHDVDDRMTTYELALGDRAFRDHFTRSEGYFYMVRMAASQPREAELRRWTFSELRRSTRPVPQLERRFSGRNAEQTISAVAELHGDESTAFATAVEGGGAEVYWASLDTEETSAPAEIDWDVLGLAVAGDRVVALCAHAETETTGTGLAVIAFEREGDALVERGRKEWEADDVDSTWGRHIVHFDGEAIYFTVPMGVFDGAEGVIGTRFSRIDGPYAEYPIRRGAALSSFIVARYGLVATSPNWVGVFEPWCR